AAASKGRTAGDPSPTSSAPRHSRPPIPSPTAPPPSPASAWATAKAPPATSAAPSLSIPISPRCGGRSTRSGRRSDFTAGGGPAPLRAVKYPATIPPVRRRRTPSCHSERERRIWWEGGEKSFATRCLEGLSSTQILTQHSIQVVLGKRTTCAMLGEHSCGEGRPRCLPRGRREPMTMSAMLLPEFDQEMKSTRKLLERVPEGRFDFRPHPKSRPLGPLASHIADIPRRAVDVVEKESLDVAPQGAAPPRPAPAASRQEILDRFDANVAAARAALAGATDAQLVVPWSLVAGGHTLFTVPRIGAIRAIVLSHIIHHRAQLGVYLRINDVPVPAIYGPSADEGAF